MLQEKVNAAVDAVNKVNHGAIGSPSGIPKEQLVIDNHTSAPSRFSAEF